jgi:eukaryotic-like serine/threonine-protein kinase
MTPERYQLVDQVFQAALELDPARRAAFLDEACNGDQTLRSEVESLITSDRGGLSFIDEPAFEMAARVLASDEPVLAAGTRIDRYEIVSLLGSGGMGEVYLAHDERLDRKIALKLLPSESTTNHERVRRFQQEARAASALNHPNIITIHEVGEVDRRHFIATEFIDGETLRERMRRGRLTLLESLEIAIQICSALAAAHKAGIVHRDIKPENIMLRADGYVKVLDFGLAKLTQQEETPIAAGGADEKLEASSGLLMGTVKYMSPEQAQGQQVDQRSDTFSLGVVIYEMLTGQAPFRGSTASEMISSIRRDEPVPLKERASATRDELQRIVNKALCKEKDARYQTAEELLSELKKLNLRLEPVGIERVMVQMKQHKIATSVSMALVVLALAGISFGLFRYNRHRQVPFQSIVMTRLTNYGDGWSPAISPDGKWVVYVRGEGLDKPSPKHSVCLRRIGESTETEVVPPTEGQFGNLGFLPDGKNIFYRLRLSNQPMATYVMPVSGGPATKLPINGGGAISYSTDGRYVAYIYNDMAQGTTNLIVANADGTNQQTIATRQKPNSFFTSVAPSWSPDGKKIACVGQYGFEGAPRVIEVDLETRTEKPITSSKWGNMRGVAWLPDGKGLLLTASEETSPILQIWYISYPTGEPHRITNSAMNHFSLSLSSDGTQLISDASWAPTSIWALPVTAASSDRYLSVDTDSGKQINVTNFVGLTLFNFLRLSWTPDARIVYVSQESGNADIWSMKADGSDRKQLTIDPHSDTWPEVSPDGRSILFMSDRSGAEIIWRMDIDGGNQTRLIGDPMELFPVFSPDGKFIYYSSSDSGKETIWKMAITGGERTQVISDTSAGQAPSPDGKLLAYYNSGKILVVPIDGGPPIKTFDGDNGKLQWSPDGRALTYLVNRDFVPNLWIQPLDGGEARQLTNFTSQGISNYAWSRDGKQIAVARTSFKSDIVLISDVR